MLHFRKQVVAVICQGVVGADRASETRGRILEAAFELFAEKGFTGATTREIADRADVNEVTIFRHFRSKEALFQEGIELYSPVAILTAELQERLTGDDVRSNLAHLASQYLKAALPRAKVIHLGMTDAARNPELRRIVGQIPQRLEQHLTDYLFGLEGQGRIRQRDFALVAHLFYGMLFQHVLSSCGVPDCVRRSDIVDGDLAETLADLFSEYLRPEPAASVPEGGTH
ncbi:MAG: helix-turn-helix domain containing protein [Thermaerobacter sp.]|nr:helix-turn-helix domain containing protein [Thermaerobacter sp.]